MKISKMIIAAVGGLSLIAVAGAANADTIEATTSGVINPPTADGVTITFVPGVLSTNSSANGIQFGTFDVSGVSPDTATFNSDFTLTVAQTLPTVDGGPIAGTITGTVAFYDNNLGLTVTGGSLSLTGGGIVTSNVVYTLYSGNIGDNIASDYSFTAPVFGAIDFSTSVPVPASALSGSALLGTLLVAKMRKRSKMA